MQHQRSALVYHLATEYSTHPSEGSLKLKEKPVLFLELIALFLVDKL